MRFLAVVAVLIVPCVLAGPWFDLNQSPQVEMDMGTTQELDNLFDGFKIAYNRQYSSDYEEGVRKAIFAANLQMIRSHNRLYDAGQKSYYLGINQFTDMTNEEYRQFNRLTLIDANRTRGSTFLSLSNVQIPTQVDWRKKGYVTAVKNQGHCGSCWAFSTTGSLEGQHFRKTGKLISLSEQQLVDCSSSYGNNGCNGGLMDNAFQYIEACKGLTSETQYPYTAREGSCKFTPDMAKAPCTGYTDVRRSEEALQEAVATVGPVSVAIDASQSSFQMYSGGVYDEPDCSSTRLDHGVLAVGYGTSGGQDYWLVKNSWGESWGESGYIKMSRNKDNQCGIATSASYPLV